MLEISVMVAIVMSVSEIVKRVGIVKTKYIPIVNLVFGIAIAIAYSGLGVRESIIDGILIGISANGFHSGCKNLTEGIKVKINGTNENSNNILENEFKIIEDCSEEQVKDK